MILTAQQEIHFEVHCIPRCWDAKVEYLFDVDSGVTATDRGPFVEYNAELKGRKIIDFTLIDDDGCEFSSFGQNCLPDYVPYINQAILSDIDYMEAVGIGDFEGKAVSEVIEKYRELVGDSASEGKEVVR